MSGGGSPRETSVASVVKMGRWAYIPRPAENPYPRLRAENRRASVVKDVSDGLRYLALGDSYTIGTGVTPAESWPAQLAARLRASGVAVEEPEVIARDGWTTDELEAAIAGAGPRGPYDLVTLLVGVNNQYRGRDLAEFGEQFARLLKRAVELAGGRAPRVLVLSIPDWGVTPFAASKGRDPARVASEVAAFNQVAASTCEGDGVAFIDVTGVSREAAADAGLLASDGLHPSGAMYRRWIDVVLPFATRALAGPRT